MAKTKGDVWTDLEMLRDGSARWLWQVRDGSGLFRCGVATSRTDAESHARRALELYADRLLAGVDPAPADPVPMLDLDELERQRPEDVG